MCDCVCVCVKRWNVGRSWCLESNPEEPRTLYRHIPHSTAIRLVMVMEKSIQRLSSHFEIFASFTLIQCAEDKLLISFFLFLFCLSHILFCVNFCAGNRFANTCTQAELPVKYFFNHTHSRKWGNNAQHHGTELTLCHFEAQINNLWQWQWQWFGEHQQHFTRHIKPCGYRMWRWRTIFRAIESHWIIADRNAYALFLINVCFRMFQSLIDFDVLCCCVRPFHSPSVVFSLAIVHVCQSFQEVHGSFFSPSDYSGVWIALV